MILPIVSWDFLFQTLINCPICMSSRQSDGGDSSTEDFFLEVALDCVKLTKAIQHNPFISLQSVLSDLIPIGSLLKVL